MSYDTRKETTSTKKSKQVMSKSRNNRIKQLKQQDKLIELYRAKVSDKGDKE